MRLKCNGQRPFGKGAIIVAELGYVKVESGEVLEIDATMASILLKNYPGCFSKIEQQEEKIISNKKDKMLQTGGMFDKDFS